MEIEYLKKKLFSTLSRNNQNESTDLILDFIENQATFNNFRTYLIDIYDIDIISESPYNYKKLYKELVEIFFKKEFRLIREAFLFFDLVDRMERENNETKESLIQMRERKRELLAKQISKKLNNEEILQLEELNEYILNIFESFFPIDDKDRIEMLFSQDNKFTNELEHALKIGNEIEVITRPFIKKINNILFFFSKFIK